MSAEDEMNLIRQARIERREDLQQVTDAHIGQMGANILLLQQANMQQILFGKPVLPGALTGTAANPQQPAQEPQP